MMMQLFPTRVTAEFVNCPILVSTCYTLQPGHRTAVSTMLLSSRMSGTSYKLHIKCGVLSHYGGR